MSRLLELFNACTEDEKREGLRWYSDANAFCEMAAAEHSIPPDIVAAVVSVLSPRNKWERNKADTENMIKAFLSGQSMETFSVCTFTRNKERAWQLLHERPSTFDPDKFFKGLKTRCFWDNIVRAESPRVTVDTWAARAAYATRKNWNRSIRASEYLRIEKQYQNAARVVGIAPKDFQAVVWVRVRNNLSD